MRTFVVSILFLLSLDIFAEGTQPTKFQWKWSDNQILELNEYHDVFFRVGNRSVSREDRNRVLLKTSKCDNLGCQVSAWFDTYIRFGKTEGPFQKDKKFDSQFTIFRNGKYEVPDEYVMPNLRSFPTFPDTELNVGDSWKLPAEESFDFSGERIKIAVEPEYSYLGKDKWQFQKESGFTDKISYTYPIFYDNRDKKPRKGNVPNKIFGFARGVVYFDSKKGLPEYKEVKLSYTFILPDGTLQEASYDIQGIYHTRRSLNTAEKDKFTEDVLKDLIVGDISQPNPLNLNQKTESPISVRKTDDGVTFSLDSILFDFNDSNLKPEASEAIKRISEILKKHSEREIRVSGHTDNVGKKDYNLKLSEDRAKSVLNELVDKHKLDDRKISFHGYGDSVPVVPNDTEENRAKNRRVEITLILD
ncbi:MAG: OmpA family protein [Leptospira sp.]|nr:OmpA family protein [Leptospira sp.]